MNPVLLAFGLSVAVAAAPPSTPGPELPRRGLLGAALADTGNMVIVKSVLPGSAAARAQLAAGDVIRAVGGRPVGAALEVVQAIRHLSSGSTMRLTIARQSRERVLSITLGAPPDESDPNVQTLYESVSVQGTRRRTLLDVPKAGAGPRPAVLLIGGIGCFSVDVAANPEDGYLRAMRDLARAGFITMRLEKSGVGDSQGPPCHDVNFQDESASYAVALDALRHDARVDPAHVYLLGHSIGTLIAPRLALRGGVAGVIVTEAVGRNWFEYELLSLRRQLELAGDTPDVVDRKLQSKEYCMHRLLVVHDPESQIEADEPECKTRNGIYPVAAEYMQQVAAVNIIEPWTKIHLPVLAIHGASDYVVARDDRDRIVDVVNRHAPGLASAATIGAMDHNLQIAATPAEFFARNATGSPGRYQTGFSDVVVRWMCAREHCPDSASLASP
jgi:alpha-beta hydrolase superfamily lysophospholipase